MLCPIEPALAEQARIVQLLVERVDMQEGVLEVRIRAEGLASLIGELRQSGERKAARKRAPRPSWTEARSWCALICASSAGAAAAHRRARRQRTRPAHQAPARQRHGQGDRPRFSTSTWPGATKPTRFARPSAQGAAGQARRARAAQRPASGSARARASEQMASWCLRIGMAMKLRPSSSSSRCCGVAFTALSLANPSKK